MKLLIFASLFLIVDNHARASRLGEPLYHPR